MTIILNLCLVAILAASAASVAASVAPILILMLAIDSASQKTYEKTYHTSQSEYWSKFYVTRSIEVIMRSRLVVFLFVTLIGMYLMVIPAH